MDKKEVFKNEIKLGLQMLAEPLSADGINYLAERLSKVDTEVNEANNPAAQSLINLLEGVDHSVNVLEIVANWMINTPEATVYQVNEMGKKIGQTIDIMKDWRRIIEMTKRLM